MKKTLITTFIFAIIMEFTIIISYSVEPEEILQNPKQLRIPIPCNGQLNFFEFRPELTKINEIKTELFEEEHRYMWINHHWSSTKSQNRICIYKGAL